MSDRNDQNWVPIAAGLLVSAGILAVIYKMFYTGCRGTLKNTLNQQTSIPFKCTCKKSGKSQVGAEVKV